MGLTNIKQKVQKSWDKGKGIGDTIFTTFNRLFVDTHSEFLIPILIITMLWILITHTI